jgi:hypothetical protein
VQKQPADRMLREQGTKRTCGVLSKKQLNENSGGVVSLDFVVLARSWSS